MTPTPEIPKLQSSAFDGKGFGQLAALVARHTTEQQLGNITGLPQESSIPKEIAHKVPGRLAAYILGDEETYSGDVTKGLEAAARISGEAIGFAGDEALSKDPKVQIDLGVAFATLKLSRQAGVMDSVYKAFSDGRTRGAARGDEQRVLRKLEENFQLPHDVPRKEIEARIAAYAQRSGGKFDVNVFEVFQRQLLRDKEETVALPTLARRARLAYLNLSIDDQTRAVAEKIIGKMFATKANVPIAYSNLHGLGLPKDMLAHWRSERNAFLSSPLKEWVTRAVAREKVLRAIQKSGVYGKEPLASLRSGWVGKEVETSIEFLRDKKKGQPDSTYSPSRIMRRLSQEADRRIRRGSVSDLKFAQAILVSFGGLYTSEDMAKFQKDMADPELVIEALREKLIHKQSQDLADAKESAAALGLKPQEEDFDARVSRYGLREIEASLEWRRDHQSRKKGSETLLREQLTKLEARKTTLKRLEAKDDLAGIASSMDNRKKQLGKLGNSQADQLARNRLEVELNALRHARERRQLYLLAKTLDQVEDSLVSREQRLGEDKAPDDERARITAELRILYDRRADLVRLSGKTDPKDIERSIKNRNAELSGLGTSDKDKLKRRKIEIEIMQLTRAKLALSL